MALVIDTGLVLNEKIRINNVIGSENDLNKIKMSLENNNIKIKTIKEEKNCVIITSRVKSIFGKIIGKDEYRIKVEKCE